MEILYSLWNGNMGTNVITVEWKHGNMCIHCGMETWEHMYSLWNGNWEHMHSLWNENMGTHVITVEWKHGNT